MITKITNKELAEYFGYINVTFTRWKNKGEPKLLARYEWLKVAGLLIKNKINPYEVLEMAKENIELKAKMEKLRGLGK